MIGEYDRKFLQEAKRKIEVVYNYHYGCPKDKKIVYRLETILKKLDYLIEDEQREDDGKKKLS